MIIRKTQIEALEEASVNNFVGEMARHCEEFSPHLTKTLNNEQLNEAVRHGIEKAEEYGFTQRGPVRFFIDLMIVFGSDFDTDPQYPWIAEILNPGSDASGNAKDNQAKDEKSAEQFETPVVQQTSEDEPSQMERSEMLFEKTSEYLKKIDGEKNKYTLEALQELSDRLEQGLTFNKENFDADMLKLMEEIHPRKYEETGEEALRELVGKSKSKGLKELEFRTPRSVALVIVLAFAFGHEFDKDRFLPWIAKTLNKEETPPAEKAEELEKRAVIWLKAVLKNAREAN